MMIPWIICVILLVVCMGQYLSILRKNDTISEMQTRITQYEHWVTNLNTWVGQEIDARKHGVAEFKVCKN
jgi:hypothetical protein